MSKKVIGLYLLSMGLVIFCSNVEAAPNSNSASKRSPERTGSTFNEKLEIMADDQEEGTDVFAIPLDDSDVEDQIQINLDEKRNPNRLDLPKVPESKRR